MKGVDYYLDMAEKILSHSSPLFQYVLHEDTRKDIDRFMGVAKTVCACSGRRDVAIPIEFAHLFMKTSASLYDTAKSSKQKDYGSFYKNSGYFSDQLSKLMKKFDELRGITK